MHLNMSAAIGSLPFNSYKFIIGFMDLKKEGAKLMRRMGDRKRW